MGMSAPTAAASITARAAVGSIICIAACILSSRLSNITGLTAITAHTLAMP